MNRKFWFLVVLNAIVLLGTFRVVLRLEKLEVQHLRFRTTSHREYNGQDGGSKTLSKPEFDTKNDKVSEARTGDKPSIKIPALSDGAELLTKAAQLPTIKFSKSQQTGGALSNPALILFCFNRTNYLKQTLESLSTLKGLGNFTVYISQDGNSSAVADLVRSVGVTHFTKPRVRNFEHWQRERIPQLGPKQPGHAWLTQHYKYGLDRVFLEKEHSHAVIVEDDMLFSPDFLTLFEATAPLLEADPSLWCVSTWNDNGLKTFEWDAKKLFRTSYFPGLGWMMRRELWQELGPQWPAESWDHWMRLDTTAKRRDCIVPEVNRNKNIGETGANMDKRMYKRYLAVMNWNQDPMNVSDYGDLSYLLLGNYQPHMRQVMRNATAWDWRHSRAINAPGGGLYLITYKLEEYTRLASQFKTWPYPRGHFRNVGYLRFKGSTFLLADQRFCDLLDDSLRIRPSDTLNATAAIQNESCDSACARLGLKCSRADFWFLNTCAELRKHFPCEAGCEMVLGSDVPNYVMEPTLDTFHKCLVTQQQSKCGAKHPSTARLCPCVSTSPPHHR